MMRTEGAEEKGSVSKASRLRRSGSGAFQCSHQAARLNVFPPIVGSSCSPLVRCHLGSLPRRALVVAFWRSAGNGVESGIFTGVGPAALDVPFAAWQGDLARWAGDSLLDLLVSTAATPSDAPTSPADGAATPSRVPAEYSPSDHPAVLTLASSP